MNALPAAIFFIASISWRAFWASALACLVLSRAAASSDSRVFESSCKVSCFFTRAWSSCCTSPTRASCFSRSVRSVAALLSASDSACFRVATSVVAPGISTMILSFFATTSYIYIYKVLFTFVLLELPLGKAELFLGPLEVLLQCGDLRSQCSRGQQRSLHTHIEILVLDSCRYY